VILQLSLRSCPVVCVISRQGQRNKARPFSGVINWGADVVPEASEIGSVEKESEMLGRRYNIGYPE
jgi:hypothetical protein